MIWNKLRSRKGETLTETLVALLIVGLSSVVLASMIGAASRMGIQAAERDEELREEISAAETRTGSGQSGDVTVKIDGTDINFPVSYYGEEGKLHSYQYVKPGEETS